MTLLEKFKNYKGCLIRLKTQLYWYGIGWDGNPGRVCLMLDLRLPSLAVAAFASGNSSSKFDVLLLVNGSQQWVCVDNDVVELIKD